MRNMGEVFQALLDGKVLKTSSFFFRMIDGELVHLNKDLTYNSKFMLGTFIFNEPEAYSVYEKEESIKRYTTEEAVELLRNGKEIKGKLWTWDYLYVYKGKVLNSRGDILYNNLFEFKKHYSYIYGSSHRWIEFVKE